MGFNYLKATEPLRGGSLLFTTTFPEIPGTRRDEWLSRPWSQPVVLNVSDCLLGILRKASLEFIKESRVKK